MTQQQPSYGVVHGPPVGEISRRGFMRRVLGVGIGILSLEFLGGTLAFLWPNLTEGLGAEITLGSADDINTLWPDWQNGLPFVYNAANRPALIPRKPLPPPLPPRSGEAGG